MLEATDGCLKVREYTNSVKQVFTEGKILIAEAAQSLRASRSCGNPLAVNRVWAVDRYKMASFT